MFSVIWLGRFRFETKIQLFNKNHRIFNVEKKKNEREMDSIVFRLHERIFGNGYLLILESSNSLFIDC